ncbi:C4-dicarboxylate transporter [Citrobacter koseri]|uniref:C4-dicarboxylate transporter n=1 Tax=Citrobacter koseri TaxID=545 RepID=A0A447UPP4_CITKO|nr:C4-dicarboxylate transporter [Citrobacter koseri]
MLLFAGLALLTVTVLFYPENSILYGKAKSTGSTWLDIFSFAKESLTTQIAGIGLIIMAAGGFASYMDHIKASNAMVNMCIRPLQVIKAPYLILALGYICAQLLHVAISSAAGLAMLLLVTFFPVLVRLGVSKASAAAMIGLCAFMDLGPAVGTANLAAKHAGMESAIYFAHYQMPVAVVVMLAVAVVIFFTAKYFDKKDGFVPGMEEVAEAEEEGRKVPAIYALLPVLPVILVLVFSPLAIASIKIDVVTAMILGAVVAFSSSCSPRVISAPVAKGCRYFSKEWEACLPVSFLYWSARISMPRGYRRSAQWTISFSPYKAPVWALPV